MENKEPKPIELSGIESNPFGTVALRDIKTKKDDKSDSLSELFKCIEALETAREKMLNYSSSVKDSARKGRLEKYNRGLLTVAEDLLDMSKEKIRENKLENPEDVVDQMVGPIE
jgi:hypothetical protein